MTGQLFAFVGNFFFNPKSMGISVYKVDRKTGSLSFLKNYDDNVAVGQQYFDTENKMLYILDERESQYGHIGGGGYLKTYRFDSTKERLSFVNELETLGAFPCFVTLTKSKKYALVAHHAEIFHANKISFDEYGHFAPKVVTDDTPLDLIRLNEDGSLDQIKSIYLTNDDKRGLSRQHSVVADPSGSIFLVCDKGNDKIYSFKVDEDRGDLILLCENKTRLGLAPRYGVFHPKLPLFYCNNEAANILSIYQYDIISGVLNNVENIELYKADCTLNEKIEASDIIFNEYHQVIYISLRGLNQIVVYSIDATGHLTYQQTLSSHGVNPRGLAMTPDHKFLFCMNMMSSTITSFTILSDGKLNFSGIQVQDYCPANMVFYDENV